MRYVVLAAVMVVVGVAWCAAVVVTMASVLLRPKRMGDGRALVLLRRLGPGDLGLPFEPVTFTVIDECDKGKLPIAGWWIPAAAPGDRCAILVHGYSDAKVGALAWAPTFHELGYHLLVIDLRAHGESGGRYCTAGFYERHDLDQVIDQLRVTRPEQSRQLVLFGVSLGAAVVAATAALRGQRPDAKDDLAAVILECPFNRFRNAAANQAARLGLPGFPLQGAAFAAAQRLGRCNFSQVDPIRTIPQIACPVLWIYAHDDPFVSSQNAAELRQAMRERNSARDQIWELPGVHHVVGLRDDPAEYRRRLEAFLR